MDACMYITYLGLPSVRPCLFPRKESPEQVPVANFQAQTASILSSFKFFQDVAQT